MLDLRIKVGIEKQSLRRVAKRERIRAFGQYPMNTVFDLFEQTANRRCNHRHAGTERSGSDARLAGLGVG